MWDEESAGYAGERHRRLLREAAARRRAARPHRPYTDRAAGRCRMAENGAMDDLDTDTRGTARGDLFPRLWPLVAVAWLPLLAVPLAALLREHPSPTRLLATTILLGCFVALYLLLVLRRPFPAPTLAAAEVRWRLLLVVALTATGLTLYPLFGAGMPLWYLVYGTIAAGVALPPRTAGGAVALVTALATGASVAANGWLKALPPAMGLAAIGGSAIAAGRLVVALGELRAAREELARLAVAEERLRFARDLHDLLGHSLSLITLKSELARELVPSAPQRAIAELRDVEAAARAALREVRTTVTGYRQPTLAEELAGARAMLTSAGIAARIRQDGGALPAALDATLAWAVREGVTNVIRHSGARCCVIRLAQAEEAITLEVADDGRGGATGGGNGLLGLAERVAAHGGAVVAGPCAGTGFRLRVNLPLDPPAGREARR